MHEKEPLTETTTTREEKFPLTKQQEGLWIEWKLHPDNTSYNTCVKLRLDGALDKDRFEEALQNIVKFFSSLRVYFTEEKGLPYQVISTDTGFVMRYEDISIEGQTQENDAQITEAKAFLENLLRTPVDLKTFPIARVGLIKTAPQTHYFIGIVPHMISDGVSAVLFLESLSIAYNEGMEGLINAYGDQQKDWGDYFEESQSAYNEDFVKDASAYWAERMKGAAHTVDFSYGRHKDGNAIKTGKRVYFDLDEPLSTALKNYSRSQRTTLFSTLVAAFGTLIQRYYHHDDLLIGYPVNIRPAGYKHLFGFFVNIIPIRVDMSGDPSFEELVGRISVSRKADKKFQTFPAMDLVREVRKNLPGFDGRMFNVSMAQTVSRLVNLRLDGINSAPLEAEYNDVNDDLALSYEILEDGRIGLWLEYREGLFTSDFIAQMIDHMQFLLPQYVESPQQKLSEFKLLDDDARQKMFALTTPENEAEKAYDESDTIHGLIEKSIAQNADKTALMYDDQEITYAKMNARANQLAHYLLDQGLQKGESVGLLLNRGPMQIISLLAVMKAGGTYIPIPPCLPDERLAHIIEDADCKHIITEDKVFDLGDGENKIKQTSDLKVHIFEQLKNTLSELNEDNPDIGVSGADRSYIIFTSGSTGRPKGVVLNHENVVPRLIWMQKEIPLDDSDAVLQNTDYSFDVSVVEIFWPLINGARLILTESEKNKDPSYLLGLIEQHKITTSCMVPSLLNSLLAVLRDHDIGSIRRIIAAGEALPISLMEMFHEKCPGTLYNIYGPTEAAIYSAYKKCARDEELTAMTIGRPLDDTTLYVLDDNLNPLPINVAGELYIGGPGLAQGYLNRDDLTAAQFIPDPFSDDPKARLYKSGDLARFLNNGEVEHLGRIDAQVKIRGFRIELAEIQTVLSEYGGVSDVAVIDHGEAGAKRLIAYYVAGGEIAAEDLKSYLSAKLPDYMIPAFFARIDEIPRLSSDKINRRALPNPENLVKRRAAYVAPESKIEKQLAQIWADILKIPAGKIGVHDSFFDIGGDSLMAIQFVCAAEEEGIVFETDMLFQHNTIADLAKAASKAPANDSSQYGRIDQNPIEGTYPLLPRQQKFFDDGFVNPHHWNRFFFFESDHDPSLENLQAAFDAVLMHHDNIRISFTQDENGGWQQNCAANLPDTKYVFFHDLSDLDEAAQDQQIVKTCNDYHAAIRLDEAPLIRVAYFKTGANTGKLGVVIHHLLMDIVTSRIIFEDFLKSYEAQRRGMDIPLSSKTSPVKDWSNYLVDLTKSHDFSEEIAYWGADHLSARPAVKTDHARTEKGLEASCSSKKFILSAEETEQLLHQIPGEHGIGIQDFLLGALVQSTQSWTNENELVVNICGHGRNGAKGFNLSRTSGWLNTVYPVYLSADENHDTLAHFKHAKAQIEAVPPRNEYYNLLYYISRNEEIRKNGTADIFFNYVSQIDALIPEGLSFNPIPEPAGIMISDPQNHLCYKLYIEAGVVDKKLNVHITYAQDLFKPETIAEFAQIFQSAVRKALKAF